MTGQRLTHTPGDDILAEVADLLIEQNRLLGAILDRLPRPVEVQTLALTPQAKGEGGPVEVTEPAPPAPPGEAKPVKEPAEPTPPGDARPVSEPAPKRRQSEPDDGTSVPPPPPRAGRGSGKEAWSSFASLAGVSIPDGASRDDIIAACARAKVIDPE